MKRIVAIVCVILFISGTTVAQTPIEIQYLDIAIKMLNRKDYKDAADYCTKSIKERSTKRAYWVRGDAYWNLGEYRNAVDDYHSAAIYDDKDPESRATLYFYMGECYIKLKDPYKAYIYFKVSEKIDYPKNPNKKALCKYLGDLLLDEKNYKEAIPYYTKAIELTEVYRELSTIYQARGFCYFMLYDYEPAQADLNKAVNYNSDNDNAYWLRSLNQQARYKYAEALTDISRSIELLKQLDTLTNNSIFAERLREKGFCLYNLNRNTEAIEVFQQSLRKDSNEYYANYQLGLVHTVLSDWLLAERYLTKALGVAKSNTQKAETLVSRAKAARKTFRFGLALKDYTSAIALDSTQSRNYVERADIYFYKRDFKNASKDYSSSIRLLYESSSSWNDSTTLSNRHVDRGIAKGLAGDLKGMEADFLISLSLNEKYPWVLYRIAYYQKTLLKDVKSAQVNCQNAITRELAMDTCKDYSFAQVIAGNLQEAVKNQTRIIARYQQTIHKNVIALAFFNLACIYAIAGDAGNAFKNLEIALGARFDNYERVWFDVYLESLRKMSQWKTLMTKHKVPSPKW